MSFLDHPEWVRGQGAATTVQSNLPLHNFDLYLEKNKDISCIVYRNFDRNPTPLSTQYRGLDGTQFNGSYLPQHSRECVRPVITKLREAIETLLSSKREYNGLLREYAEHLELPAPYLFIYHGRTDLEKMQIDLSPQAKTQLSVFLEYVVKQYQDEYGVADALLARKRISPQYIRYLFKPGDLLVSYVDGGYMGFVATSWPHVNFDKEVSRVRAATSRRSTSMPLYGSQEADATLGADTITIHMCEINAWHWAFDGNFQRQYSTLYLEIPAVESKGEKPYMNGKEKDTAQDERKGCKGETPSQI